MSGSKSDVTKKTPPFEPPSDLDAQVRAAIEEQRSRGENFQNPTILRLSDISPLLNLIHSITGRAAILSVNSDIMAGLELVKAYGTGYFESFLCKYFNQPTEDFARTESDMAVINRGDSLRDQFRTPYKGNLPVIFVRKLETLRKKLSVGLQQELAYNWSIAVVQSSGMGKSRMIREISRTTFVIPINLREALPDCIKKYSPADHDVRNYFEAGIEETDNAIQARCAIFLTKLFTHVTNLIQTWEERGPELALRWSNYLEQGESTEGVGPNRLRLYQEVVKQSNRVSHLTFLDNKRMSHLPVRRVPERLKFKTLVGKLKLACQELTNALAKKYYSIYFYVAFDEAHTLTKPRDKGLIDPEKDRSIHSNLEGVLKYLDDAPVFFIFLSTNSRLYQLTQSPKSHPSGPRTWDGQVLLTPWTELPFDVFAQQTVEAHKPITLEKISSVKFMVGFGRALWHTNFHHQVARHEHVDHFHTLQVAKNKLAPTGTDPSECYLAAIGVRIGLTFDPSSTTGREVEYRMVERHMRVALMVPSHREFMRTTAPSEPVLAEAAGRVCVLKRHAPTTLLKYLRQAVLARGERQEVVGRLLLTLAHDDARVPLATTAPLETQYHRPILLIDLLKALFHTNHHPKVLDARPTGNARGTPLQEAFKDAYVHFSHFGIARDCVVLDVKNMHKCLTRGMAIQSTAAQCNIDAVIPVHLGPITSPVSEETTTSLNLCFNNHEDPWPCFIDHTVVVPNGSVPSLSLILELGATRTERISEHGVGRSHEVVPPGAYWDDRHYEIVAYGHDTETYAVIPEGEEALYSDILAASELDMEYSHSNDEEMAKTRKQMMPKVGEQSLFLPKSYCLRS